MVPRIDYLVAMSDGITDAKIPTEQDLGNWDKWETFLQDDLTAAVDLSPKNPLASQQLLEWLDYWVTGEHDDRTIVIMRDTGGN